MKAEDAIEGPAADGTATHNKELNSNRVEGEKLDETESFLTEFGSVATLAEGLDAPGWTKL